MIDDQVLLNDWHPVATSQSVQDKPVPAQLLEREIVLWRDPQGNVAAWEDRCPHRGAQLSLGRVIDGKLACPYHSWRFDGAGRCTLMPAQPDFTPSAKVRTHTFLAKERYGLVWVCLGKPACDIVPFEEHDDPRLRAILAGPYHVKACGPRVVENFIDMAHFPYVHGGTLGDEQAPAVPPYTVEHFVDSSGVDGVRAFGCRFIQPKANLQASFPAGVDYSYRISRPLSAILTKRIDGSDVAEGISLHVQPVDEMTSRVWVVFAGVRSEDPDDSVRNFQDMVFEQDRPILESQRPKRLPLQLQAEQPQRADALSIAYRRLLKAIGLRLGIEP